MTDLTNLISDAVAAKMTPEFIEKEVNTRVEKLIIESVNSALRSYSETGRLIEKAVSDALKVDRLDLPAYGETVCKILKSQIEARVSDLVSGQLSKDMDKLLKLAPKEIKLSEIAEEMLEGAKAEELDGITVIVGSESYGSRYIYLDERNQYTDREKYKCSHSLLVGSDGSIFSATVDGKNTTDTKTIGIGYGLGQKIRAWVACGTKLIIDEEDVQTEVGYD